MAWFIIRTLFFAILAAGLAFGTNPSHRRLVHSPASNLFAPAHFNVNHGIESSSFSSLLLNGSAAPIFLIFTPQQPAYLILTNESLLPIVLADLQKSAIANSRNLEAHLPPPSPKVASSATSSQAQQKRASNITPYPPTLLSIEIIVNLTREVSDQIGRLEGRWLDAGFDRQKTDENFYRGEKNEFGQRHGVGRIEAPEGDAFLGQWVRGTPNEADVPLRMKI
jgi:hypothetical protein